MDRVLACFVVFLWYSRGTFGRVQRTRVHACPRIELNAFRDRLVAASKAKKAALMAVARELLTILNVLARSARS